MAVASRRERAEAPLEAGEAWRKLGENGAVSATASKNDPVILNNGTDGRGRKFFYLATSLSCTVWSLRYNGKEFALGLRVGCHDICKVRSVKLLLLPTLCSTIRY